MKRIIAVLVAILILSVIFVLLQKEGVKKVPEDTFINTVVYRCDEGRSITASYYRGGEAPAVKEGEMPRPTGYVEVAVGSAGTTTLKQTVSGSGIRYASEDESLAFWSKGDEALIMRNNAMDLDYKNCLSVKAVPQS